MVGGRMMMLPHVDASVKIALKISHKQNRHYDPKH